MNCKYFTRGIRPLILMFVLGASFIYAGIAGAQERGATASAAARQFTTTLQANDRQLASIEALFGQIEAAKTDQDRDRLADGLERSLSAYAEAMIASMNTALNQAGVSVRSQGKEGTTELLKPFEDLAASHEMRLKKLDDRAQMIKPKDGSIQTPATREKAAFNWQMPKLSDFFISSAEAAIALSVYAACHQSPPNQSACAQAISNGVTQTNAAHNAFNACWNSYANRKPAWWRAILRGSCVAALAARLA